MKKKELGELIDIALPRAPGNKATVIFADRLKDLGFEYGDARPASRSASTTW